MFRMVATNPGGARPGGPLCVRCRGFECGVVAWEPEFSGWCSEVGLAMTAALLGFALAATLLIMAPGPDTMLVVRNSLRGGSRAGMCTAAGTFTGLLAWALAATFGITSLVAASRAGYDVLRFVGAAYLIWLGVTSLWPRHRAAPGPDGTADEPATGPGTVPATVGGTGTGATTRPAPARPVGLRRAYINGVVSNLCNPKIGAFFVAFLPAFIPTGVSVREFSLLLGIWFAIETGIWLSALVWMVRRGVGWLTRPRARRRLEQVTGVVLIGFGLRLATEAR